MALFFILQLVKMLFAFLFRRWKCLLAAKRVIYIYMRRFSTLLRKMCASLLLPRVESVCAAAAIVCSLLFALKSVSLQSSLIMQLLRDKSSFHTTGSEQKMQTHSENSFFQRPSNGEFIVEIYIVFQQI